MASAANTVCQLPAHRSAPGVVFGNLLVVSYREMRRFPASESCTVGALRASAADVDMSYLSNEQVKGRGVVHAKAEDLTRHFVSATS